MRYWRSMNDFHYLETLPVETMARNELRQQKPGGLRCLRCALPLEIEKAIPFRFHHGGLYAVTLEEGDKLNKEGHENEDLGIHPLGPECAKHIPKK
jgi:hypothetical protein